MLVLSRKEHESILIEGQIKVIVLKIKGGRIRLGIEAPQSVPVCRAELLESQANPVVIDPLLMSKACR